MMKATIFGMGYVGSVTAACLAKQGHDVTGIDMDSGKVALINSSQSPIMEPGLDQAMQAAVAEGRLRAETRCESLGDISLVCVGTPSNDNGSLDLRQVLRVCEDIGRLLKTTGPYHVVNIRSTVIPGTVEGQIIPLLESLSGKKAGQDFGVCMNPEFLRESTAMKDFFNPPFTVVGASDDRSARVVSMLYAGIECPLEIVPIRVAETIKYTCNAFHALKVTFANEIGNLCKALGVDSWQVMDIFCKDNKLNLSSYYLKPGFAFGGSCLPKDLRAIVHLARQLDLDLPVLGSVLASNQIQIERAYHLVRRTGKIKVAVLGLSFKAGSDDLRESPTVAFIERLIGKGYQVAVYDSDVTLSEIRGKNKLFIERTLPHISTLMKPSLAEAISHAEVLVVCKKQKEFEPAVAAVDGKMTVIDFVRLISNGSQNKSSYEGICW
jgi:GDP-mannose 6-dehydrogenase